MVTLGALWLPIVLSAVLVFVVSSVVHMVLKYHASDYTQLPNEDAVRAAIQSGKPRPAQYIIPYVADLKLLEKPEVKQKFVDGPVAVLNIRRTGPMSMGPSLAQWFVFSLVISYIVAYVASRTLPAGTDYLHVFRVVGTVAWLGYAGATIPDSIWMGQPWSVTIKHVIDGLLYGLVTAGTFGWLWPR
ncbi:MAG TPA: hypothetical protein VFW66_11455 [Gemmatimonadales bacterium]|nr:hypothetical protein [Gemmatimonadales bacterium]